MAIWDNVEGLGTYGDWQTLSRYNTVHPNVVCQPLSNATAGQFCKVEIPREESSIRATRRQDNAEPGDGAPVRARKQDSFREKTLK